jgi:hypothetical protein
MLLSPPRRRTRTHVARRMLSLGRTDRDGLCQATDALSAPQHRGLLKLGLGLEAAAVEVRREVSPSTAESYRRALLAVTGRLRGREHAQHSSPRDYAVHLEPVGDYVAEVSLGHGGNGLVYVARHRSTGRRVLLKLNAGAEHLVAV